MTDILKAIEAASDVSRISVETRETHPGLSRVLQDSLRVELAALGLTDEQGMPIECVNLKGKKRARVQP